MRTAEAIADELFGDPRRNELWGSPDFSILVERLPSTLETSISESDVRRWVESEVARSAPSAQVISKVDQKERFDRAKCNFDDAVSTLTYYDTLNRRLYVRIGHMVDSDYTSFYTADLEFSRSAYLVSGITQADVWSESSYGYYGTNFSAEEVLREAVVKLVIKFCDEWVIANKEVKKPSPK